MAETPTMQQWIRHPLFKYGMLTVITLLLVVHLWTLLLDGPGTVFGAKLGLVVVGMLLVNHVSASFLTQQQQRRFRPLQLAVILGGIAYFALTFWRDSGA